MSFLLLDILTGKSSSDSQDYFSLSYTTSPKFENDKINFQNNEYHLLLDGVVLNKQQLINERGISNWADLIIELYKKNGCDFHSVLKGTYYGFIYDKNKDKWIVFNDHISSKPIYFTKFNGHICFSNNYIKLVQHLKKNKQAVSLNERAAYLLLTYGFVFEDITITNQIDRLMVGYNAVIESGGLQLKKYFTLENIPIKISEDEAIEEIDHRFRSAVQSSFEKDKEYGYKHLAGLSGGLDSRMTVWVAHMLGYKKQLNFTFSQSNYLDETIAKDIAADLKHEWLFKALDNGNFLEKIDNTSKISGGNVLYYGLAHGLSLYENINFENYGIVHSGQLGDVVISSFYSSLDENKPFKLGDGAYSNNLLNFIKDLKLKEEYPNEEIFKMYIRGFYGANQGLLGVMEYSETYSPFYDIDFMQFCLSIPIKLRYRHSIYKKWIISKYPQAAKYVWEQEKVPIDYKYWVSVKGKKFPLSQLHAVISRKLGFSRNELQTKNHMNPLEYWYNTNLDLRKFMDSYFEDHISLLDDFPTLKINCEHLYKYSTGSQRNQVLSLIAAVKQL